MLQRLEEQLNRRSPVRWRGRVTRVTGNLIESEGPFGSVGDACEIQVASGGHCAGQIVGFRCKTMLSMITEDPTGIRLGDEVTSLGCPPSVAVGPDMLGRVLDANGQPLDGLGSYRSIRMAEIDSTAPKPLNRLPIREPLGCGIRALDAFTTCGRGQRLGIFGGSGVGKSTLLGMMCRGTSADVIVMGLVGERGREVGEFLETIGEEGCRRSVIVVSTSNEPPLMRLRASLLATAIAETFAGEGKHVLLVVDSLTRFAMAQREIGLAAGEPPTAKGYTPSVINKLARLVERAGRFREGSITAFYTVLMEGDDQQDPIVDTVRSLLDGHIILDRGLATKGHYPPIAVLDSLSRLMPSVVGTDHLKKVAEIRQLLAAYSHSEDLIRIGAYQRGSDPLLDRAVEVLPKIQDFLRQETSSLCTFEETVKLLSALPS